MGKLLKSLGKLEIAATAIMFAVMIFAIFLQVLDRNIFKIGLGWTEELGRYSMIWMVLLGTQAGFRVGNQLAVEFLYNKLPKKAQKGVFVFDKLAIIFFMVVVFVFAFNILNVQISSNQTSPALKIPMWLPYSAVVVFAFLTIINQIIELKRGFKNEPGNELAEDNAEGEF